MPLHHYLVVGAILFALGMIGFLARRNLIIMFLCAEMMLQGVAINLVAFARYRGNLQGQAFILFILTVAACEAAIALALILMLYRSATSLDVSIGRSCASRARSRPGRGAAAAGAAPRRRCRTDARRHRTRTPCRGEPCLMCDPISG